MSSHDDLLIRAVKGDADALLLLRQYIAVLHFWDDLVDRDKPLADETINRAMMIATLELPANPFFRAHCDELMPIMQNAVRNWRVANAFERAGEQLEAAHIMRSSFVDVVAQTAQIIGGVEWGTQIAREVRVLTHHEDFQTYLHNLAAEAAARGG